MVHALKEAHRVLKPGGILIDLRPAAEHRRLGTGMGRQWRLVGLLHEVLGDDHAANAAIAHVVLEGYFHPDKRTEFELDRVMDTVPEIREWLSDFDERREIPRHEPLVQRLEQRLRSLRRTTRISVRGTMTLGVLTKTELLASHQQTRRKQ